MLTGTEPSKTADSVRIFKSIVIKDLPIQLRQTQGSSALGPWTLKTLGQFGFELGNLLVQQQQIGLPECKFSDDPIRNESPQVVKGLRLPPVAFTAIALAQHQAAALGPKGFARAHQLIVLATASPQLSPLRVGHTHNPQDVAIPS